MMLKLPMSDDATPAKVRLTNGLGVGATIVSITHEGPVNVLAI